MGCLDFPDHYNILSGMGELLTEKQKTLVKAHLISEVLFSLRLALDKEKSLIQKETKQSDIKE